MNDLANKTILSKITRNFVNTKTIIPASTPNIISGGITEEAVQPLGAGGNTGGTLGDDWGNARWGNTGGTLGEQSVVLDAGIPACTLGEYWGNTGRTCTLGNTGGTLGEHRGQQSAQ